MTNMQTPAYESVASAEPEASVKTDSVSLPQVQTSNSTDNASTLESGVTDNRTREQKEDDHNAVSEIGFVRWVHLCYTVVSFVIYIITILNATHTMDRGYFVEYLSTTPTAAMAHLLCERQCRISQRDIKTARQENKHIERAEANKAWRRLLFAFLLQFVAVITMVPTGHVLRLQAGKC